MTSRDKTLSVSSLLSQTLFTGQEFPTGTLNGNLNDGPLEDWVGKSFLISSLFLIIILLPSLQTVLITVVPSLLTGFMVLLLGGTIEGTILFLLSRSLLLSCGFGWFDLFWTFTAFGGALVVLIASFLFKVDNFEGRLELWLVTPNAVLLLGCCSLEVELMRTGDSFTSFIKHSLVIESEKKNQLILKSDKQS